MQNTVALFALCAAPLLGGLQLLPPPNDGDIRVVYWALRGQTEVFLTIDPHSGRASAPPSGVRLTFARQFAGKTAAPATNDTPIEVTAYPGMLWAPRAELSFEIDGARVPLAPPGASFVTTGPLPASMSGSTTVGLLARIGAADRVDGDALGWRFELTAEERRAFRSFVERLEQAYLGSDPRDRRPAGVVPAGRLPFSGSSTRRPAAVRAAADWREGQ